MAHMTRSDFEQQLTTLRNRLLDMATAADEMVGRAMRALSDQDVTLAESVIASDDVLDALDIEIEDLCFKLVALQQPVARDLRLIGTALKISTDLERIGDHAVDIAKAARTLADTPFQEPLVDLPRMETAVRQMLHQAIAAFVSNTPEQIAAIISADDIVDSNYKQARSLLEKTMQERPELVLRGVNLLFVAHYLERIADHAVNVAERVYFIETGTLTDLAESHKPSS